MQREFPIIRVNDGQFTAGIHTVVEETPLTVNVNGRTAVTAMVSPNEIEEFVVGFLYTERIIEGIDDIESMKVEKNIVNVLTKNLFKAIGAKKIVLSGCGGISSPFDLQRLPRITSAFAVSAASIAEGMKQLLTEDSGIHKMTGGVHAVGLSRGDGLIIRSQDIGRHNAFDKVIGRALREGIDLSRSFALTSGRISSEMVRKCLVAGIPIIASRGATTSLAIETAERTGLCVIGFVRAGKMNIYTHPEHIEGALAHQ
ncbi:MAG: formate dehydrogenase accessory sulfurtransferase FdhD [Methanomicrobiales archaeon]|nr:formate dehydrogenase accessory sulfurtransferase FdhD [Methanomicrobiales archaeon]MDI6875638.1 formate dehydrogenase accessory sulfurtransferase FdhD [Methanomicrobiales archaeon]